MTYFDQSHWTAHDNRLGGMPKGLMSRMNRAFTGSIRSPKHMIDAEVRREEARRAVDNLLR